MRGSNRAVCTGVQRGRGGRETHTHSGTAGGGCLCQPGPVICPASSSSNHFRLLHARSAVNKAALLHDLISDRHIDLLALTETWVTSNTPRAVYADLVPPGYAVLNVPREIRRGGPQQGGGLAVVFRDSIVDRPLALTNLNVKTSELQTVRIIAPPSSHVVVNIYRPPSTPLAGDIFDELADVISEVDVHSNDNIILLSRAKT